MAFVKVSKAQRQKMFREGGYRERDIMKKVHLRNEQRGL